MLTNAVGADEYFDELESELILPEQFYGESRRNWRQSGERQLLAAVLADALSCFEKYACATTRGGRRRFREVEEWIMEQGTGAALEFDYVCSVLGLDAETLRRRLRSRRERGRESEGSARKVVVHMVPRRTVRRKAVGE